MSELGVEDIGHSVVGASGAYRWMNCAGSNQLVAKIKGQHGEKALRGSGMAAAQGTAAHTLLADSLNQGKEPWEWTGTLIPVEGWSGFVADADMVDAVSLAHSHINETVALHWRDEPVMFVERPVRHPDHPDLFGTLDWGLVVHRAKKIYIKDYKHGIGVNVEPTGPQLRYYALVLIADVFRDQFKDMLDYEVELTIMQPRQPHHAGPIRTYKTTVQGLVDWFNDELLPAYKATLEPTATLLIGEWCGFCPARDMCPALRQAAMSVNLAVEPQELSDEEVGTLMSNLKAVEKYLEGLEELALQRVKSGRTIPGFKLVKKRANRVWKEGVDKELLETFKHEAWKPRELKGPPAIEKMEGGAKFVSRWAYSPDTGYTLAKDSDKRPAVKPLMDDFMDRVDGAVEVSEGIPEDA
jgi:hypothetical protein